MPGFFSKYCALAILKFSIVNKSSFKILITGAVICDGPRISGDSLSITSPCRISRLAIKYRPNFSLFAIYEKINFTYYSNI